MSDQTTPLFWNCECGNSYIHPKTETICHICGCSSDAQPDSMIREVINHPPVRRFVGPPCDEYGNVTYGRVVIEAKMILNTSREAETVDLQVLRPGWFQWPTVSDRYFIPVQAEPGKLTWRQYRDLIVSIPDLPEWMYTAVKRYDHLDTSGW